MSMHPSMPQLELCVSRWAYSAGASWNLDTRCQSLQEEVIEMQGLWEMRLLTKCPVMFLSSTTKEEDLKVEMQKLVKNKIIP